jgi:hypothetical protein
MLCNGPCGCESAHRRSCQDRLTDVRRGALFAVVVVCQEILHLFSLLHAVGLQCLRGDDNLDNLNMFDPFEGYRQSLGMTVVPRLSLPLEADLPPGHLYLECRLPDTRPTHVHRPF